MFVRRSTYNDLKARYEHASEKLGKAREELADWKGSAIRVAGRNTELTRRLESTRDVASEDIEYMGQLESRLARVLRACVRYRASLAAETRRAALLSSHFDDGDLKAIKQWEARVRAHDEWNPPTGPDAWEKRPVDGASARPLHPAVELRRALEQCRILQARLDASGKRVAS